MYQCIDEKRVCISLVEKKNADSKNVERKNIESAFNAASIHSIHA